MPPRSRSKNCTTPLEGKRASDNSWHDCEVSIGSHGVLKVQFCGLQNEEQSISSTDELSAILWLRSKALAKGQCMQLQEVDLVVASQNLMAGNPQYFDARIEKIVRQKHSARAICRCSMELVWLDRGMEEQTCVVPTNQVRQIVKGDIVGHPVISEWLVNKKSESNNLYEQSDIGSDVQAQLEEEIDRITLMAEKLHCSRKLSADTNETDSRGRTSRAKGKVQSKATPTVSRFAKSFHKRAALKSARGSSKEDSQPAEVPATKQHLSPLAARAGLAATVSRDPVRSPSTSLIFLLTAPTELQNNREVVRKLETSTVFTKEGSICGRSKASRGATCQRASARIGRVHSPLTLSCEKANLLLPIYMTRQPDHGKKHSENQNKTKNGFVSLIPMADTPSESKIRKLEYLAEKENTVPDSHMNKAKISLPTLAQNMTNNSKSVKPKSTKHNPPVQSKDAAAMADADSGADAVMQHWEQAVETTENDCRRHEAPEAALGKSLETLPKRRNARTVQKAILPKPSAKPWPRVMSLQLPWLRLMLLQCGEMPWELKQGIERQEQIKNLFNQHLRTSQQVLQ